MSIQSRLTQSLLRLFRLRESLTRQWMNPPVRKADEGCPPKSYHRKYRLQTTIFQGRAVYELAPKEGPTTPLHVVYLHGGAYMSNANPPNWSLVARLVEALGCIVFAPDYPLAPEHPAPAAFDFTRAFYHHLATTGGLAPAQLALLGDSAGGGLALALCQQLAAEGKPQPRHLAMLWPWLDLAVSDPLSVEVEPTDVLLTIAGIRAAARHYAGPAADLTAPRLSPLYGPMTGLPEMSVFIGTRDLLLADSRRLRQQAMAAGLSLDYHEYAGMPHGWMLLPFLPESKAALAQLAACLQRVPARVA